MIFWWMLFGVACSLFKPPVLTTDEEGMVGQIVDPTGRPALGIKVETLEAEVRTDLSGIFALPYKEPDQYVHFTRKRLWFKQEYLPNQKGKTVVIQLPFRKQRTLECGEWEGLVQLNWIFEDGLSARLNQRCQPDEVIRFESVPTVAPTVAVRPTPTDAWNTDIELEVTESVWRLQSPLMPMAVHLSAISPPAECELRVDNQVVGTLADGEAKIQARGDSWLSAVCDGRVTVPARAKDGAELIWSAEGPRIEPIDALQANTLSIYSPDGWVLEIPVGSQGYALPELPKGMYRLVFHQLEDKPELGLAEEPEVIQPGQVYLEGGAHPSGWLFIDEPLPPDAIPLRRLQ